MDKDVEEVQRYKNKEEALAALENTLRNEPDRNSESHKEWKQLWPSISKEAAALGASEYEISRIHFSTMPEDERQSLFSVYRQTMDEYDTLEESRDYIDMLIKIRDEFNLKDRI